MSQPPFEFGPASLKRLAECHPDLQKIAHELIKEMDVTVLCGFRNEAMQRSAFIAGLSKLNWPHSMHNRKPSLAMDIAPYSATYPGGVNWKDEASFLRMCRLIEEIAERLKIKIRLGRDFPFRDMPHVELHPKHKDLK